MWGVGLAMMMMMMAQLRYKSAVAIELLHHKRPVVRYPCMSIASGRISISGRVPGRPSLQTAPARGAREPAAWPLPAAIGLCAQCDGSKRLQLQVRSAGAHCAQSESERSKNGVGAGAHVGMGDAGQAAPQKRMALWAHPNPRGMTAVRVKEPLDVL